jgi:hypothetical protein
VAVLPFADHVLISRGQCHSRSLVDIKVWICSWSLKVNSGRLLDYVVGFCYT